MRYIYVDNFRGFTNTLIPIKDVNFLVGENSTGKTSILAAINLMSTMAFWINQDFNTNAFRFGGFQDIVSAESANKKSFRIGFLDYRMNPKTEQEQVQFHCSLFTFKEEDGQPSLYRFTRINDTEIMKLMFLRSRIKYKTGRSIKLSTEEEVLAYFKNSLPNG